MQKKKSYKILIKFLKIGQIYYLIKHVRSSTLTKVFFMFY